MTTVIIPNHGRVESDALTRALVDLAAAGLCLGQPRSRWVEDSLPTPHTPNFGYPITQANGAKRRPGAIIGRWHLYGSSFTAP